MFKFYLLKISLKIMYLLFQLLDDILAAHPYGPAIAKSAILDTSKRNHLVEIIATHMFQTLNR